MMTDPIADMLTRIRNGSNEKHKSVSVPMSKIKVDIVEILKEEGYIKDYQIEDEGVQGTITIELKYGENDERIISGIKRISKPGLRVYVNSKDLPKVLGGLGIAIISTSQGVLTDKEARNLGIGGEVICYVW